MKNRKLEILSLGGKLTQKPKIRNGRLSAIKMIVVRKIASEFYQKFCKESTEPE